MALNSRINIAKTQLLIPQPSARSGPSARNAFRKHFQENPAHVSEKQAKQTPSSKRRAISLISFLEKFDKLVYSQPFDKKDESAFVLVGLSTIFDKDAKTCDFIIHLQGKTPSPVLKLLKNSLASSSDSVVLMERESKESLQILKNKAREAGPEIDTYEISKNVPAAMVSGRIFDVSIEENRQSYDFFSGMFNKYRSKYDCSFI